MKKQTGITLIALIITIIVLLILAGVTINLTLGEKGIFKTAQRAVQNYKDAQDQELIYLNNFEQEMNNTIKGLGNNNNPTFGTIIKTENNIKYTADGQGNVIPVPEGFTATTGTKATGFVIVNDTDRNEFVWIPVDNIADYKRSIWGDQFFDGNNIGMNVNGENVIYSETIPTSPVNQQESVSRYKGYYIGRYEAGISSATARRGSDANESADVATIQSASGKPLSQSGKHVYNYITRDQARGLAEGLYNKASNNVTSTLCSGYAWDTALKFIETNYPTYPTNSTQGNYSSDLRTTGQSTSVNNIYDMGGNVWEWTTGMCSVDGIPCVVRGGCLMYERQFFCVSMWVS